MERLYVLLLVLNSASSFSQEYTRKDSLRGNLTDIRTCYDVTFYDLNVVIDDQEKSIERSTNTIHFKALSDFNCIQIDLAANMEIMAIEFEGKEIKMG